MNSVQHLVLLGLMGAGKTTVGSQLAGLLGWPLSDSDTVIEREQGATVRELGERLGVDGMHELEAQHLLAALAYAEPSVVCAAASVIDVAPCREALTAPEVFAVWLEVDPGRLAARFSGGQHRPVFDPDAERMFRRQLSQRATWFAEVADYRVRSDRGNPARTAELVAQALAARAR